MGTFRRFLCFFCGIILVVSLISPVRAAEEDSARDLVQQMLNYYRHHQGSAKTDIDRLLEQLETVNSDEAAFWRSIFDHWFYAVTDLPKNNTTLPDCLPRDDSLCIVVLGYRLQPTGAMEPELIGRLELALQAAQQYPEAMIVCTGGGTASEAPGTTEAHQMAGWLKGQGIDSGRILTESRSYDTIRNAQLSLQLLARDYPQVRNLILVTSDYHLPRSSTLFYTQTLLTAKENGTDPISIAAYLGYDAGHEGFSEDPLDQTAHVARICGFEYEKADAPVLSRLTGLLIDAPSILDAGEELALTVTACYDSGYSRDVTELCEIFGYDPMTLQTRRITVTYEENGIQQTASAEITLPEPETEPPTEAPTDPSAPETLPAEPAPARKMQPLLLFLIPAGLIGAGILISRLRKKR